MIVSEKEALLKINSASDYGSGWIADYLKSHKNPSEILKKTAYEISFEAGINIDRSESFLKKAHSFNASKEMAKSLGRGYEIFFYGDDNYPECFSDLEDPPLAFYVKGKFSSILAIAVVGSRACDSYGLDYAGKITFDLARSNIAIVSGLARGVDTKAHKSALKAKGKTFAVIGSGLDNIYPKENEKLIDDIVSADGFILSEYTLDCEPLKHNFPRRNRLISALSWGTFVVQADYKSGALITARYALDQGKEVFALPGNADNPLSNGTNKLIKDGAIMAVSAKDIIEALPLELLKNVKPNKIDEPIKNNNLNFLGKSGVLIYKFIEKNPDITANEISLGLTLPVPDVLNMIFELESAELICSGPGGRYRRVLK